MNPLYQHLSYVTFSTIAALPPFLLSRYISRARHRNLLFKAGFTYNIIFVLIQINFLLKGEFPYLPDLQDSYIIFLALVFATFHCLNIGALERKVYTNTDTSSAFDNSLLNSLNVNIDRILSTAKWTLFILATSVFYTIIIGYLLTLLLPIESLDIPTRRKYGLALYLLISAIRAYLTYLHHKSKRYKPAFKVERAPLFNLTEKRLRNIFYGLRPNWIFLAAAIYCAAMSIVLLDRFTDFDVSTSPYRNLIKCVSYLFFLVLWLYGTIIHHRFKRKKDMKNIK